MNTLHHKRLPSILCLVLVHVLTTQATDTIGTVFKRRHNTQVDQTLQFSLGPRPDDRMSCVMTCSAHAQCQSVNFRPSDNQCMGVGRGVYSFAANLSADTGVENFSPQDTEVRDGEWTLVYRAQRGLDTVKAKLTMQAWRDDTLRSDDDLSSLHRDCYSPYDHTCSDFFRSKLMADWPSDVQKVRLALFKDGQQVAEMVFNGTNTTRESWYHTDMLLTSTWTDMTPGDSANIFSIPGHLSERRVFVATTTADDNNCDQLGWLLVEGAYGNRCQYDVMSTSMGNELPQFLYAPASTKINFKDNGYEKADVMAIFIKRP